MDLEPIIRFILTELRGAWRFRWYAMGVAWVIGIFGIVHALTLPNLYEARAQVYVDTRDPLAQARRAGDDAAQKVAYVRRLLLSTPNLEQVARETDLDLRAATPESFQNLVLKLQRDITVRAGSSRGFEANLYTIALRDADVRMAERVVQVLLNRFQEQSVEGDLRDDLQALAFLDAQMAEYRRRLEEAENRVADFRRRHAGLVGGEGGFFARLEALGEQLREVRANLQIAQEKRVALSAQVSAAESGSGQGEPGGTSLLELQARVLQMEQQVDELRLRYTDEHPSVISAQETQATLQERLERRREELGSLLGNMGAAGTIVDNVRLALAHTDIEITELRGREADLLRRIEEMQQRVEIAPQLEAELAGLNRDHSVLRSQYESLLQRRELLRFDIERKRQGRQLEFRIIEPPFGNPDPVAPDRFGLIFMAFVASLALGAGLAYGLHLLRPVFANSEMVYQQLGIPVLGTVSMAWTQRANWQRRSTEALFVLGLLGLACVFGAVFVALPQMTDLAQRFLA